MLNIHANEQILYKEMLEYQDAISVPTLQLLWGFKCEATKGLSVASFGNQSKTWSLGWNRSNPDILAVGYGNAGSESGLIACWSLKNPEVGILSWANTVA